MLKNRQNQVSIDIKTFSEADTSPMLENCDTKPPSRASQMKKLMKFQQGSVKDAATEQHTRSRSFSSLQSIFTRQRRPSLKRAMSQMSINSAKSLSEDNTASSSSSCSIASSTASKESTFSKIASLFPLKVNNKSTLPLADKTSAILSKKSLEFEALLEEFPTRTIKASLTPCTAA